VLILARRLDARWPGAALGLIATFRQWTLRGATLEHLNGAAATPLRALVLALRTNCTALKAASPLPGRRIGATCRAHRIAITGPTSRGSELRPCIAAYPLRLLSSKRRPTPETPSRWLAADVLSALSVVSLGLCRLLGVRFIATGVRSRRSTARSNPATSLHHATRSYVYENRARSRA